MKPQANLNTKVLGLFTSLFLLGCGVEQKRLQQCKAVVKNYSQIAHFEQQSTQTLGQSWRVDFSFSVQSALGPQAGTASCEYQLDKHGDIASKPYAITLGKTRHSGAANIDDLLSGLFADGFKLEDDHGH